MKDLPSNSQTVHDYRRKRVPATKDELDVRRTTHRIWAAVAALLIIVGGVTVAADRFAPPPTAAHVVAKCIGNGDGLISTRFIEICENASIAAMDEWTRPTLKKYAERAE
ncbi:MAG: hypothetical protein AAFU68_02975 [Pseudomonadota bacterium]